MPEWPGAGGTLAVPDAIVVGVEVNTDQADEEVNKFTEEKGKALEALGKKFEDAFNTRNISRSIAGLKNIFDQFGGSVDDVTKKVVDGLLAGAEAGAHLGAAFGPIGSAAGAAFGSVIGYIAEADKAEAEFEKHIQNLANDLDHMAARYELFGEKFNFDQALKGLQEYQDKFKEFRSGHIGPGADVLFFEEHQKEVEDYGRGAVDSLEAVSKEYGKLITQAKEAGKADLAERFKDAQGSVQGLIKQLGETDDVFGNVANSAALMGIKIAGGVTTTLKGAVENSVSGYLQDAKTLADAEEAGKKTGEAIRKGIAAAKIQNELAEAMFEAGKALVEPEKISQALSTAMEEAAQNLQFPGRETSLAEQIFGKDLPELTSALAQERAKQIAIDQAWAEQDLAITAERWRKERQEIDRAQKEWGELADVAEHQIAGVAADSFRAMFDAISSGDSVLGGAGKGAQRAASEALKALGSRAIAEGFYDELKAGELALTGDFAQAGPLAAIGAALIALGYDLGVAGGFAGRGLSSGAGGYGSGGSYGGGGGRSFGGGSGRANLGPQDTGFNRPIVYAFYEGSNNIYAGDSRRSRVRAARQLDDIQQTGQESGRGGVRRRNP